MKNKSTILAALVCAVAVFLTASFIKDLTTPTMDAYTWTETTHYMREGETLWSVAAEYCPADVDRNEWIERVADINGIQSYIIPAGDRITVLIPE